MAAKAVLGSLSYQSIPVNILSSRFTGDLLSDLLSPGKKPKQKGHKGHQETV
jgi:hypothetical protein